MLCRALVGAPGAGGAQLVVQSHLFCWDGLETNSEQGAATLRLLKPWLDQETERLLTFWPSLKQLKEVQIHKIN